jgi:hypothetical protein
MAHDVYISYATRDRSAAHALRNALEQRAIRCWTPDTDLVPGTAWTDAITEAIRVSRVMVLLISATTETSTAVRREVAFALSQGSAVMPIRIDDVRPTGALAYDIGTRQWLDAFPPPFEQHLGKVADSVERVLAQLDRSTSPISSQAVVASPSPTPAKEVRSGGLFGSLTQIVSGIAAFWDARAERRADADVQLASVVAEQLSANRLEDLAHVRVGRSVQPALATIDGDLPANLERVARQAGQSLSVQDPGRQIEAIETALRLLSGILSVSSNQTGPVAGAVVDIAASWIDLFSTARNTAQAALDEAKEIENPFVFGNPVHAMDNSLFTGRRDVALEIERNILRVAQAPTLLLYGQRRMGKTSILNQLPALLGSRFLPVLVDCQAPAMAESPAALLRYLSRCLAGALNTRLGIVHEDASVRRARGAVPLELEALRTDGYSLFEDWLDAFQARLPVETHLLLCLDEFERLQEPVRAGWGIRFLDGLRHWLQHRPLFALMFTGSHTFEQLGPVWTDRFLSARRLKVSFLEADDVRHLLTRPTATFQLTYAPGALERIMEETRGQPFLTKVLASELVHHMNRLRRKQATIADVEATIDDAVERSAEFFADLWFSRNQDERAVLRAAASGEIAPPTSVTGRALREYDLLDDCGDFAVPLVKRWIERNQMDAEPMLPKQAR